ncbi:hypothetical protein EalM132_00040 [Exiguobacterium phage vB_EalM-132]|nr:hypothetical protein EalM132_00040 [Exiguobacterium phage vB_EalM-132]
MSYGGQAKVTAFGAMIKKAVVHESVEEAKKEHRGTLSELVAQYKDDVATGKAVGIRNAKDLIEVMKLDLLLMGEATERTDTTGDTIHLNRIESTVDMENPEVMSVIDNILANINAMNDAEDSKPIKEPHRVSDHVDYNPESLVDEETAESEDQE